MPTRRADPLTGRQPAAWHRARVQHDPFIPVPLAARRRRARLIAGAVVLLITVAAALTPIAWTLLPLTLVRARRGGACSGVVIAGSGCFALGLGWIDLAALAHFPGVLGGPWLALVAGTMAASGAWACEKRRDLADVLRVAALVALVAAPWSPLTGLALALGCRAIASRPRRSFAANDNQPLTRRRAPILLTSAVSYPPIRSARPAAFD